MKFITFSLTVILACFAVIQSFGNRMNFHPHLHFLVSEGGKIKSTGSIRSRASMIPCSAGLSHWRSSCFFLENSGLTGSLCKRY
ncbi:MAG: transposase [Elusimicrobiota bacterium]